MKGFRRSVFAYPYVVFAIVFLLAPLFLIIFYSITQPINSFSVAVGQEFSEADMISQLDFIGYENTDGGNTPGTYYKDGEMLTVNNYRERNAEIYSITFNEDKTVIEKLEEYYNGELFDEPNNVKFINKSSGFVLTIDHFKRFFSNSTYIEVFLRSIYIAFFSTVFCLLLGFPTAYILSKMKPGVRNFLSVMFLLPMWMNFLLRTYAWRTLIEKTGIINTLLSSVGLPIQEMMYTKGAVILCMVYDFLPFMILPIYNTLIKLDKSVLEASHDLGANHYQTLFKVIIPLSFPGVSSGITMTFVPSITAFAISKIMGGTQSSTIGEVIEREFNYDNWFGSAISVIIMVLMLLSMMLLSSKDKDEVSGGGLL